MTKCYICKTDQTVLGRLSEELKIETPKTTEVCENRECSLFINVSKVKNWRIKQRSVFQKR